MMLGSHSVVTTQVQVGLIVMDKNYRMKAVLTTGYCVSMQSNTIILQQDTRLPFNLLIVSHSSCLGNRVRIGRLPANEV